MNMVKIHERFTPPTKFDFAEFGSVCKIATDHGQELYIQTSKDEEKPHWMTMGHFLEKALIDFIPKTEFMNECLNLFGQHQTFPYRATNKIIDIMTGK